MAFQQLTTFITMKQAGNYCGISQNWQIEDPSLTDAYALAKDLVDAMDVPIAGLRYLTLLLDCLATDTFVKTIRCRRINPANANNAVHFFQDGENVGTFAGITDALNVAGCIVFLTGGNAGLTGRQFLPGVSEGAYENGRAVAGYSTAITDYVDMLLAGVEGNAGVFFPVIKHGSPATYTLITNGYLSPTPGTQRRRRVPW